MPARFFCKTGELAGAAFAIDREATIGRRKDNEITLPPTFISGRHARIFFDEEKGGYYVEDLGSSNGTLLDGMAVHEPMRLDRLNVVTLAGQFDFIFQVVPELSQRPAKGAGSRLSVPDNGEMTIFGAAFEALPSLNAETEDTAEKTMAGNIFDALPALVAADDEEEGTDPDDAFDILPPLSPPTPEAPAPADPDPDDDLIDRASLPPSAPWTLAVTLPGGISLDFPLTDGTHIVGRDPTCTVALPDNSISRNHARLTVREGRVFLQDLESKNATVVDGKKITEEVEVFAETPIGFGLQIKAQLRPTP